jgi:hypothetical protein
MAELIGQVPAGGIMVCNLLTALLSAGSGYCLTAGLHVLINGAAYEISERSRRLPKQSAASHVRPVVLPRCVQFYGL